MAKSNDKTKAKSAEEKVDKKGANAERGGGPNKKSSSNNYKGNGKNGKGQSGEPKRVKMSSELLKATANLSFPVAAGYTVTQYANVPVNHEDGKGIEKNGTLLGVNIPGIIRLGTVAACGKLDTWNDPGNVWLRAVFSDIRKSNSGSANYDSASLGQYFMVYRSCLDYLNWMQNLYGLMMNAYVPENKYVPINLVNAYGGDYAALLRTLPQLRYYALTFAQRLNQMKVPSMPFFTSGVGRTTPVFMDVADTAKASYYVVAPDAFWRFHIGETAAETYLYTVPTPSGDLDSIITFGDAMLNELLNSQDFNIMSGDIIKAYDKFTEITSIAADFIVAPVYDNGALWMFHNATCIAAHPSYLHDQWRHVTIKQYVEEDTPDSKLGALKMDMVFKANLSDPNDLDRATVATMLSSSYDALMDIPTAPEPELIGALSQLITLGTSEVNNASHQLMYRVVYCQSTIVSSLCVCVQPSNQSVSEFGMWRTLSAPIIGRFDLAPYVHNVTFGYAEPNGFLTMSTPTGPYGEITNVGILPRQTKFNIDMAMMLDMYGG